MILRFKRLIARGLALAATALGLFATTANAADTYGKMKSLNQTDSASRYIDSGYTCTLDTQVDIRFYTGKTTSVWTAPFGVFSAVAPNGDGVFVQLDKNRVVNGYFCSQSTATATALVQQTVTLALNRKGMTIEGTAYPFSAEASGTLLNKPLYIFACNRNGAVDKTMTSMIYWMTISENGVAKRKFVPWMSSTGENGLYDHVGKKFYGSATTSKFQACTQVDAGEFYYTIDNDMASPGTPTTLEIRRGTIDDPEILTLHETVEKMGVDTVTVPATATAFSALKLTEGTLSFAGGAATETTVNGALTLAGGATLEVDVVGDAYDTFVCDTFALANATESNPAVIRVTGAAGRDWTEGVTLIAQGVDDGLSTDAIQVAHDGPAGLKLGVEIADGKLSIVKIVMPVAHWTGAVDADVANLGNWAYTNGHGAAVSRLPDADTIVYFRGSSAPDIAAGASFAALCVEANLTLDCDRDWRGLSESIPVSGKIDLNGHKLTVANLPSNWTAEITDTCPDPTVPGGAISVNLLKSGAYNADEFKADKLIDDVADSTSRMLIKDFDGCKINYDFGKGQAKVVHGFRFRTGKNDSGRRPKSVVVYGTQDAVPDETAADAANWTKISDKIDFTTQPNDAWSSCMSFQNEVAYRAYRLEIDDNVSRDAYGDFLELYEMELTAAGGELHVNVASGTVTGGATLTGAAVLVKDGEGTLKWNGGANSVAASCPVVVTNGVFGFDTDDDDVFGSGGTITIAGKGQMDIAKRSADASGTSSPVYNRTFYIEGDGPDGKGAIVRNSANTGNLYGPHLKDVHLTDDATIGGTTRIDFRPKTGGSSMLHGEGHVLTIKNTDRVAFCGGNSGCNVDRIVVDGGFLQPCSDATGTLDVKCIELRDGGKLISWCATKTATYALTIPVEVSAGSCAIGADQGYFSVRDVEVKGGATLAVEKGSVSIAGTLSGSGAFTGTGIAFGNNSCWGIVLDVDGETNKVDFSFAPTDLKKIAVLCGGTEKQKVYDLAPAGELTYEQMEAIKLEVTDELTQQPLSESCLMLGDNRLVLTVVRGSRPTVAHWTGAALDNNIDNPANWACTNVYGEAVGELPCEFTAVYLKGDLRFDLTENPGWKSVTFESARLAKNCDFSGIEVPLSGVLDLNGKDLVLTETQMGSENAYEVTDTSAAGAGGELHVNVASDTTVKNTTVTLSGTLKLVKKGAGTFVAAKPGQTYAGGTEIAAGRAEFAQSGNPSSPWSANQALFGANGTTITVDAGARLNVSGTKGLRFYDFVLAGGTLSNENYEGQQYLLDASDTGFGNVTLTDDSTLLPLRNFVFNKGVLDLGGHTLTIDFQTFGSKAVYLVGGDANKGIVEQQIKNGTIRVVGGDTAGTTSLKLAGSGRVRATGTTLHMVQAKLDMSGSNLYVGDYISEVTASKYFAGRGALYVSGTFKPVTAFFYGCTLQNGSTLDLTAQSGVWDMTSLPNTSTIKKTIYFAANTTVYVKPGSKMGKIANWTAKPENIESVTFEPAPGTVGHYELLSDGLYRTAGLTIILR